MLVAGVFESKLMELDEEGKKAYLDETKCTSVLDKIIVQVWPLLHYRYKLFSNGIRCANNLEQIPQARAVDPDPGRKILK